MLELKGKSDRTSTNHNASSALWRCISSIQLTLALLAVLVILTMIGAWVPQTSVTERSVYLEKFGTEGTALLNWVGFANVFQSPVYLSTLGLLFLNLLCCTFTNMGPLIRKKLAGLEFADADAIRGMRESRCLSCVQSAESAASQLKAYFLQSGYSVRQKDCKLVFEKGKVGWLAAPVTHAGLFILLIGIGITSTFGYNGLVNLSTGESVEFPIAERNPVIGSLPRWRLRLDSTRKDDYPSGEVRQWFSTITVTDEEGRVTGKGTVSVNAPLAVKGIEICQSDWDLEEIKLTIADHQFNIPVQQMGPDFIGVMEILPGFMLIGSVHDDQSPLRLFFKHHGHPQPRLVATLAKDQSFTMSDVKVTFTGVSVRSGLQYKYDPGLPVTYCAFLFLFLGACLVAVPNQRIFAAIQTAASGCTILMGADQGKFRTQIKESLNAAESALENSQSVREVMLDGR